MLVYVKLFLTTAFWGGTFVAGRVVAGHVGPFSAAFLRFVIATAVLLFFVRRMEGRLPRLSKRQVPAILVLAASGVFAYNALFLTGLKTVTAGRAALIIAMNPVFINLLSAAIFKEKLTGLKIPGVALSVTGAVIVISRGNPLNILSQAVTWGDMAIMGCVAAWTVYSLVGKAVMNLVSPLSAVTYSCLIGTIFLFFPAYAEGVAVNMPGYGAAAWFGILYLGFFGTSLGFTWFYQGIKEIGPARASVFINFVPVWAMTLAFLILREPISAALIAGATLVISGVYLVNKRSGRRPEPRKGPKVP